ncbi:hypothetical protein NG796_23790 [Laspinema sp. A4]|uniref:hypothetical protein n=1 Tax=Laspinema sp. D2d TaxID=2953686 RepID=UPI0021BA4DEE|nr:hypothetical protein [Laspinema sp. D2d]MCT7986298.1 hypothetical protein [Laspinema sp. D2d]
MEPVELTAIAIWVLTAIAQGGLGKVGENLLDKGGNLWNGIQAKLPKLAADLKKPNLTPLDYGEAVRELKAAAQEDPEIREAVQEVATEAQADPNIDTQKLLEEIKVLFEGNTISGGFQGNNISGGVQANTVNGVFQGNNNNIEGGIHF